METEQTNENLDKTFITGFSALFKIAEFEKSFFSSWASVLPIISAIIILVFSLFLNVDSYKLIVEIKGLIINFLPGILGFTLAGYSLMVAFIQAGMLNEITEPSKDSKFSLYQKMSSTFAINVILQALSLVLAYFVHFLIYFDANRKEKFIYQECYLKFINTIGLLVIVYAFFISLFMIIQIVLNIFTFSQLHHYFINKEKIAAKEKLERERIEKEKLEKEQTQQ